VENAVNAVNVIEVARSIGLVADHRSEMFGTIEEEVVLAAISALATSDPGIGDLCAEAAMRVQLARSAGIEHLDATSVLNRSRTATSVQLRYRSEMADVFSDLAIDFALREADREATSLDEQLAETPA
jgi:hypothetical protein